MPRPLRIVIPGVPHHIYLRGNNRRHLFTSSADRKRMLGYLAAALEDTRCLLHQLTLMTNHVHMIVTPPEKPALGSLLKQTNEQYAQDRNRRKRGTGKLFEERYRSKVLLDDAKVMTATMYGDVNAYDADKLDAPLAHAWSTGPIHAGVDGSRIPASMWTPSRWYLSLGDCPSERAAAYVLATRAYLRGDRVELVGSVEQRDREVYQRRVRRPDNTSAREVAGHWPEKPQR